MCTLSRELSIVWSRGLVWKRLCVGPVGAEWSCCVPSRVIGVSTRRQGKRYFRVTELGLGSVGETRRVLGEFVEWIAVFREELA